MSKTCDGCKTDLKGMPPVPYAVHEDAVARMERIIKRQWIALIVAICMIVGCNALWLYVWMQYDYTSEETVVDVNSADGGNANFIGNDGDIVNGKDNGQEENKNTP